MISGQSAIRSANPPPWPVRTSQNDRRYVEISLAKHIASQAPSLADDGPIGRLEATLRTASPDERQIIKDGLALLVGLADMAGEYR
jgi:hypothetical protein